MATTGLGHFGYDSRLLIQQNDIACTARIWVTRALRGHLSSCQNFTISSLIPTALILLAGPVIAYAKVYYRSQTNFLQTTKYPKGYKLQYPIDPYSAYTRASISWRRGDRPVAGWTPQQFLIHIILLLITAKNGKILWRYNIRYWYCLELTWIYENESDFYNHSRQFPVGLSSSHNSHLAYRQGYLPGLVAGPGNVRVARPGRTNSCNTDKGHLMIIRLYTLCTAADSVTPSSQSFAVWAHDSDPLLGLKLPELADGGWGHFGYDLHCPPLPSKDHIWHRWTDAMVHAMVQLERECISQIPRYMHCKQMICRAASENKIYILWAKTSPEADYNHLAQILWGSASHTCH